MNTCFKINKDGCRTQSNVLYCLVWGFASNEMRRRIQYFLGYHRIHYRRFPNSWAVGQTVGGGGPYIGKGGVRLECPTITWSKSRVHDHHSDILPVWPWSPKEKWQYDQPSWKFWLKNFFGAQSAQNSVFSNIIQWTLKRTKILQKHKNRAARGCELHEAF